MRKQHAWRSDESCGGRNGLESFVEHAAPVQRCFRPNFATPGEEAGPLALYKTSPVAGVVGPIQPLHRRCSLIYRMFAE